MQQERQAVDVIAGTIRAWENTRLAAGKFAEYVIGDLDDYGYRIVETDKYRTVFCGEDCGCTGPCEHWDEPIRPSDDGR